MKLNHQQNRIKLILERLIDQIINDEKDCEIISEGLDTMLTGLHGDDFFGTEGQNDPRGDFRNGTWSIDHVEGIDDK